MKPVRIVILLLIVGVISGVVAWQSQWFFLQNNVIYLLNQRRFDEAISLIEKLEKRNPDNPRTDFLQVKAFTITGDFAKGVAAAGNTSKVSDPEMLYWFALAQHQMGDTREAFKTANRFLETGKTLRGGSQKIVRALSGIAPIIEPPDIDALEFRLLFPVEKAVYLGLAGLYQWEIGRLDTAAQLIRDAFVLDNRNPRFLTEGAQALALVGDVHGAQMFWDFSSEKSYKPILESLQELYHSFQTAALTLNSDDLARGGRKIDVARAVAWAAACSGDEDQGASQTLTALVDGLLEVYPDDPVLQVRKATLLHNLGNSTEALSIFNKVQENNPSFMVLVKTLNIQEISSADFSASSADFIELLKPVATMLPHQFRVEGGNRKGDTISFIGPGITTGTIEVKERGRYMLTTVAKGSDANGIWPLLQVAVDGEVTEVMYVCDEQWDTYNLPLVLEAGSHTLELIWEDEVDKPRASKTVDLHSLYLTLTGVAYVRGN